MNPAVEAFDHEWKHGDRQAAKGMAKAYVNANRAVIGPVLEPLTLEEIVSLVGSYRAQGREEDRIVADMWLLSEYAPQHITGVIRPGG